MLLRGIQRLWPIAIPLLLVGCQGVLPKPSTPIRSIQASQANAQVQVSGQVKSIAPMVGQTAYEVADETGSIWVVTHTPPPAQDAQVTVSGTVRYLPIVVSGEDVGAVYLED